ncbi:MAG: hypothetical protein ABSE85_01155 [Candidatus Korobacteraceae bacterium]|jgi:hypothetical protein
MTENSNPTAEANQEHEAAEHVADAHRKLSALRQQLDKHPDLEEAISSLEMALSILTTKTGGML